MTLVILAAGMGSRYGGLKQLDVVSDANEAIIDFSIYDAIKNGFTKVVFVVREDFLEEIKSIYLSKLKGKIEVTFVCQKLTDIPKEFKENNREKPWGTAHALLTAKKEVNENFCVINADDFYGRDSYTKIGAFLKGAIKAKQYAMVGYPVTNTLSKNGTVSRGECKLNKNNELLEVIERTAIEQISDEIVFKEGNKNIVIASSTLVSMNMWGFTPDIFTAIETQFYEFLKKHYQTEKQEFYLPTVVNNLLKENEVTVKVLATEARWMGVTYKKDKNAVVSQITSLKNKGEYPENLWS